MRYVKVGFCRARASHSGFGVSSGWAAIAAQPLLTPKPEWEAPQADAEDAEWESPV